MNLPPMKKKLYSEGADEVEIVIGKLKTKKSQEKEYCQEIIAAVSEHAKWIIFM